MDGYAVRCERIQGASSDHPKIPYLFDSVAAGSLSNIEVVQGTAIRIMSGDPIPLGADCVVPFELTNKASVLSLKCPDIWRPFLVLRQHWPSKQMVLGCHC